MFGVLALNVLQAAYALQYPHTPLPPPPSPAKHPKNTPLSPPTRQWRLQGLTPTVRVFHLLPRKSHPEDRLYVASQVHSDRKRSPPTPLLPSRRPPAHSTTHSIPPPHNPMHPSFLPWLLLPPPQRPRLQPTGDAITRLLAVRIFKALPTHAMLMLSSA